MSDNSETATPVDLPRIERAVREILAAVGEDPNRDGLLDTPSRVARMYAELFSGLKTDPARHLQKFFVEDYDELVLAESIERRELSGECVSRMSDLLNDIENAEPKWGVEFTDEPTEDETANL